MRRLTISVSEEVAAKAQRAVDHGGAPSVSAYFAALAEQEPDWVEYRAAVDEMIAEAGGISDDARRWAREALGLDTPGAQMSRDAQTTPDAQLVAP